jgi:hypothetical protein
MAGFFKNQRFLKNPAARKFLEGGLEGSLLSRRFPPVNNHFMTKLLKIV